MSEKKELQNLTQGQKEENIHRNNMNERISYVANHEMDQVYKKLNSRLMGLNDKEVEEHREHFGNNRITHQKKKTVIQRLITAFINPFTMILIFLAIVQLITDVIMPIYSQQPEDVDILAVIIITTMIIVSGVLRFVQETRSGNAAARLLEMIINTATVDRSDRGQVEIPLEDIVVGDIIHLSAGDMVPADVRIVTAKDLFISQASLTGESEPVEKFADFLATEDQQLTEYNNVAFMGSNVISGSAIGIVVANGDDTLFGTMAKSIAAEPVKTSFEKGVNAVSWVLIRFMFVMLPTIFLVNGFVKGDWFDSFLFAISIAVGLTPEMLPMIVTTCLAKGAVAMSKEKTIVKNLNSIQNLGAIDVLCTDKTGTLTQDKVVLEYHLDIKGKEDNRVLRHAYLNSYYQTGLKNLIDVAIINKTHEEEAVDEMLKNLGTIYTKIDEIPFDFSRRRMSVVVQDSTGKVQMVTKGAVEEMLAICTFVDYQGEVKPLTKEIKEEVLRTVDDLNDDGMRVIAVAQKTSPSPVGAFGVKDECDMVLIGYLAFLDPPKETTAAAIKTLMEHGVATKILTGDNHKVTRCICKQVGLAIEGMVLGSEIAEMSDHKLAVVAEKTNVFAKLSPDQKCRVIRVLRSNGHTVGFMGDGINDAAAMKEADVAISVDTAVDIAKESADIILLEKSLMVLEKGIVEGRKTYANMIKYIKMTASSNFGNMFSVLASAFALPFMPMLSIHLIFLNLIYDLSCTAIPWDNVDPEFLKIPKKWDASSVGNFMIWIGPTSSIFDWTTYLILYFVICPQFVSNGMLYKEIAEGTTVASGPLAGMDMKFAYRAMFHAGWFVESMWTQTLVIHMIRTPKVPFIQSRASAGLTFLTFTGIALLTIIPFTAFGRGLGFVALPTVFFIYLIATVLLYMALVTILKKAYVRHYGELL